MSQTNNRASGSGGGKPAYNPANYETVNDRIKRFYGEHPGGRITAEIISSLTDLGTVICRAEVYLTAEDQASGLPRGSGLASETFGVGSFANNGSHIENCETSSIGRALANAGFSGKVERASREEMEKAERWKQSPSPVPAAAPAPTPREARAQERRAQQEQEQQPPDQQQQEAKAPPDQPAPAFEAYQDGSGSEGPAPPRLFCNQCAKGLTTGQYKLSLENFGIPLCPVHQQEARRNVQQGE